MGLKDFIRATVAKTDDEGNSQGNVWVWAGTMICLQYSGCSAALGAIDCLTIHICAGEMYPVRQGNAFEYPYVIKQSCIRHKHCKPGHCKMMGMFWCSTMCSTATLGCSDCLLDPRKGSWGKGPVFGLNGEFGDADDPINEETNNTKVHPEGAPQTVGMER
jgi:hypothetical protein